MKKQVEEAEDEEGEGDEEGADEAKEAALRQAQS